MRKMTNKTASFNMNHPDAVGPRQGLTLELALRMETFIHIRHLRQAFNVSEQNCRAVLKALTKKGLLVACDFEGIDPLAGRKGSGPTFYALTKEGRKVALRNAKVENLGMTRAVIVGSR